MAWLVLVAAVQTLALVWLWRFAVRTEHGQLLDTIALTGNSIGQDRIAGPVDRLLNAMSVVSLLATTIVIGFIALIRGRVAVAVATTVLIAGANLSTQLLKYLIERPELGVDPERAAAGNSLPSGHTTIAASVAVALVLALPRKVRAGGALVGAVYTALAGVATLSAGWHRPSDAAAAILVVGAWAAVAGIVLLAVQRGDDVQVEPQDKHRGVVALLAVSGVLLLAAAVVAFTITEQVLSVPVEELSRRRLLVAYAGGAAGIAGMAALVVGGVLATVHRVVPRYRT